MKNKNKLIIDKKYLLFYGKKRLIIEILNDNDNDNIYDLNVDEKENNIYCNFYIGQDYHLYQPNNLIQKILKEKNNNDENINVIYYNGNLGKEYRFIVKKDNIIEKETIIADIY